MDIFLFKKEPTLSVGKNFEEVFSINKEQLESEVEGFGDLTEGQKALVLRNFEDVTLKTIEEDSIEKIRDEREEAGAFGRIWHGLFKNYYLAKAQKLNSKEMMEGGIDLHCEMLSQITKQTKESGIDAEFEGEKLRILYGADLENLTDEEKKIVDDFNDVAGKLTKTSSEWSYKNKDKNNLEDQYKRALAELGILAEEKGKGLPEIYMIEVDRRVRMNQFMDNNSDVEEELIKIKSQKIWKKAIKNTFTEKGGYMVMGMAARTTAVGLLGIIGAPVAASIVGGFIGRKRAIKELEEDAKLAQSGKITKAKEAKIKALEEAKEKEANPKRKDEYEREIKEIKRGGIDLITSVKSENLEKKLENLLEKFEESEEFSEEREKILEQINTRVNYTRYKIKKGLVEYGEGVEKINNRYSLLGRISEAEVRSRLSSESPEKKEIDKRLERYLVKHKEGKIRKQVKEGIKYGASFGAIFAILGYQVVDTYKSSGINLGIIDSARGFFGQLTRGEIFEEITKMLTKEGVSDETIQELKNLVPPDVEINKPGDWQTIEDLKEGGKFVGPPKPDTSTEIPPDVEINKPGDWQTIEDLKEGGKLVGLPGQEVAEAIERGISSNFTLELGQGEVPPYLERVFHTIALDHMEDIVGADGLFGAEEGAKSLNMAANLVQLAEGRGVAGINPERINDIFNWDARNNTLEIKDYAEFNKLLGELEEHSSRLWDRGVLQKGAASYLDNIKPGTWQRILEAEGLKETGGVDTGIQGHSIEPDQITDFSKDPVVLEAKGAMETTSLESQIATEASAEAEGEPISKTFSSEEVSEEAKSVSDDTSGEKAETLKSPEELSGERIVKFEGGRAEFIYDDSGNVINLRNLVFDKEFKGLTGREFFDEGYKEMIMEKFPEERWPTRMITIDAEGKRLFPYIKFYEKLNLGGYEKEADFVFGSIKKQIQIIERIYGEGVVDYSKLPDKVRKLLQA